MLLLSRRGVSAMPAGTRRRCSISPRPIGRHETPGIILISPGIDSTKTRVVWAESAANMRERLDQMLREPQADTRLESILEAYPRTVRFRCLTVYDPAQRDQLAGALCNIGDGVGPGRQRYGEPQAFTWGSAIVPKVAIPVALGS